MEFVWSMWSSVLATMFQNNISRAGIGTLDRTAIYHLRWTQQKKKNSPHKGPLKTQIHVSVENSVRFTK